MKTRKATIKNKESANNKNQAGLSEKLKLIENQAKISEGRSAFLKRETAIMHRHLKQILKEASANNPPALNKAIFREIERLEEQISYRDQLLRKNENSLASRSAVIANNYADTDANSSIKRWILKKLKNRKRKHELHKSAIRLKNEQINKIKKVLKDGTLIFDDVLKKIITPDYAKEHSRHVELNDRLIRTYKLEKLPTELSINAITTILEATLPIQITQFITANSTPYLKSSLQKQIDKLRLLDQKAINDRGGLPDPEIHKELEEALTFQNAMTHDTEKGFGFSMYVTIEAESQEDLYKKDKQLKEILESSGVTFSLYTDGQKEAFKSTLPGAQDSTETKKIYQTSVISRLIPFVTRSHTEKGGAFLGYSGGYPVFLKLFNRAMNSHINIFGKSGSGKSVSAKLLALRSYIMNDLQIAIIDITPKGEYRTLTEAVGGQVISFGKNSGINLFPETSNYAEHVQSLVTFFRFFIDEKKFDKDALEAALISMYESENERSISTLTALLKNNKMSESLINLEKGVLSGFFGSKNTLTPKSDFLLIDLTDPIINTPEYRPAFLFLAVALVKIMLKQLPEKMSKMIIFDEAHLLQTNEDTAKFHENLVKTGRHDNIGVVSITQNIEDFIFKSKYGRSVLTNPETTLLFRQNLKTVEELSSIYELPDSVRENLAVLQKGQCYMIIENEYVPLNFHVFESEKDYIKTGDQEVDTNINIEEKVIT